MVWSQLPRTCNRCSSPSGMSVGERRSGMLLCKEAFSRLADTVFGKFEGFDIVEYHVRIMFLVRASAFYTSGAHNLR